MSTQITNAFIAEYNDAVHAAYQRKGSKLMNTVRKDGEVVGSTCIFQKIGKGAALQKTRHGDLPTMNLDHSNVTATLADYYAPEYRDKLDLNKINIDEDSAIVMAGAYACGRKTDDIIITQMETATEIIAEGSAGMTKVKALNAFGTLNANDVPDDGDRFAVVGAHQWNELMNLKEFASSDYAGDVYPWLKGTESRRWLGITWMFHSGLPLSSGTRSCYVYHKSSIGLAVAQEITAEVNYVPHKAATLFNHMMTMGAILIDAEGIVEVLCDDDATIS